MPDSSNNAEWRSNFALLVNYANLCGWSVKTSPKCIDQADSEKKLISIRSTPCKSEDMCYYVLHELGHMHIFSDPAYSKRYPGLCEARARRAYGLQTYRVERVQEELDAWDVGHNIAKTLQLPIDEQKFQRMKARNVSTYMEWPLRTKRQKKQ